MRAVVEGPGLSLPGQVGKVPRSAEPAPDEIGVLILLVLDSSLGFESITPEAQQLSFPPPPPSALATAVLLSVCVNVTALCTLYEWDYTVFVAL